MPLLPRRVAPENWTPIGLAELEANADEVVRSEDHRSVIAGPGAGKTELLAQRAAFLLQTGGCKPPRRILAISFKRDAATNLAARVRQRCHPDHAARFDSMTFDAFAKGLVDRFGQALPLRWRPRPQYEIAFPKEREIRGFLEELGTPPTAVGSLADVRALTVRQFEQNHLLGRRLPADGWANPTLGQWAAAQFWEDFLRKGKTSHLTFPMIGRLAELLLRVNPLALNALRLTYSHVFLDEFQDTTQVQYDLVLTIFRESDAVLTAVGDNKQQIMRWAHAMEDPFGALQRDFSPARTPLINNYRSSPELVRMQHVLAQALDAQAVKPVSKITGSVSGQSCAIWDFSTPANEAEKLASFVNQQMQKYNLSPRDLVLLVRQKAGDYANALTPAFTRSGLLLRNEAEQVCPVMLQDLLAEDVSSLFVNFLRFATAERPGRYWSISSRSLSSLHGVTTDDVGRQAGIAQHLEFFRNAVRSAHPQPPKTLTESEDITKAFVQLVGLKILRTSYPAYRQGDWLDRLLKGLTQHLQASSLEAGDWREAMDSFEGVRAVPLMTIHKSKGLEYHTVIFVGLDDGAWWSFRRDEIEATAGFFVAFTRAKQRVLFTYCRARGNRTEIVALYDLLQAAGVTKTFVQ